MAKPKRKGPQVRTPRPHGVASPNGKGRPANDTPKHTHK